MDLFLPAIVALNGRIIPSLSSCILRHVDGRRPYRPQPRARARGHCEGPLQRPLRCLGPRLLIAPAPDVGLSITWGAARVARCAGESAERDFPSSTAAHGVRP